MLIFLRRISSICFLLNFVISCPSIKSCPSVGSINRLSKRIKVDFPEPERPIITKISPSSMVMLMSYTPTVLPVFSTISFLLLFCFTIFNAAFGRFPNILVRCFISTLFVMKSSTSFQMSVSTHLPLTLFAI